MFAIDRMRSQFSSLSRGFVFLDAPGGTQVPDSVGAAVARNFSEASGNIGFPYATSHRIAALVDEARARSAAFLGCSVDEIVFGANMTSLNFVLSRTVGRDLSAGDEILVTRLDHDANVAPWLGLAHDRGLVVREVDIHDDTTLDIEDLERLLSPWTKVVALPMASNAVGTPWTSPGSRRSPTQWAPSCGWTRSSTHRTSPSTCEPSAWTRQPTEVFQ